MKGIQNLSITFVNDNNRSARNKLSSMGGIMSSSEELIKEAQKAMPVIKDIVQAVDSPEPAQNYFLGGAVKAGLNFVPNLASNVMAKGLNPLNMITRAKPGMTTPKDGIFPTKLEKFIGTEKFRTMNKPTIKADGTVDITKPAQAFKSDMLKKFGTLTAAKQALDDTLKDIEETEKNDDSEDKKDTRDKIEDVTNKSIEKNYEDSIGPIPKGMTIGELTREYIRVAKNTAIADPGSFAERFGKKILQGIAVDLSTRGTGSKRSGTSPREDRSDAIREFAEKLMTTQSIPADQAIREAKRLIGPLYPTGGGTPSDTSTDDSNIKLTKDQQALVELAKKEIASGRDPDAVKKVLIERGIPAGVV